MALHDIDKNSMDRGNPNPNTHGKMIPEAVKAHGTISTSYTTDDSGATTNVARVQMQNNRIVIYDGTNERIVIGTLPDGTLGMAVSKAGYDVSGAYS